jgi:phenylacetate-CoA ligase
MYYEKELETLSQEKLRDLQEERLRKTVRRCYEKIPMYRRRFKEKGLSPDDIKSLDDLQKIPFTVKDDLRDHYPYGILARPLQEIVRFHSSSGTTGIPTVVGYTKKDIQTWSRIMARGIATAGVTSEDIIQVAYGYGLFTGGLGFHYGAEELGATVVPAGGGITPTKRQITIMKDMKTTVLCCTPSYSLYIAEEARKEGIDPRKDFSLRIGIFGAEPWSEGTRKKIEEALNLKAIDVYGLSEIWGPGVGMECEYQKGLHVWADHFIMEVIDPDTGEVLEPGKKGELVFTTLTRDATPLLRYRSRDISVVDEEECECGRTHPRMLRVMGRSDDMLIIRGVNVFPSQVEQVLMGIPGVGENYQIVVDRDILDKLLVRVEVTKEAASDKLSDMVELQKKIEEELSAALNVGAKVELVEYGNIPRSVGKAQRVIDLRQDKI